MIKMTFQIQKEIMTYFVVGTEIWYSDRVFDKGIRCIPKDEKFIRKIVTSRNKYPAQLLDMWNLSKDEKDEYDTIAPKGEKALAEQVIKDCKNKGLVLLKMEEVNGKS